jgi:hypothetical protein
VARTRHRPAVPGRPPAVAAGAEPLNPWRPAPRPGARPAPFDGFHDFERRVAQRITQLTARPPPSRAAEGGGPFGVDRADRRQDGPVRLDVVDDGHEIAVQSPFGTRAARPRMAFPPGVCSAAHFVFRTGREPDHCPGVGRHLDVEPHNIAVADPPGRRSPVRRFVPRRGVVQRVEQCRGDPDAPVAGFEGRKAGHAPVQPVGDRAECVVVERRHLAGVDRAVLEHRVPALPDRRRAHRHGVEPRRALGLGQQA